MTPRPLVELLRVLNWRGSRAGWKALVIIDNLFFAPASAASYPVCRFLRGLLPTRRMETVDTSQKRLWHILASACDKFSFWGVFGGDVAWRIAKNIS